MESLSGPLAGLLAGYGLLAIFAVMLLKEIGVPVPVPSDLIMIGAGVQAATRSFTLIELLLAMGIAISAGGSLQFFAARGAGRRAAYKLGRFVGLTPDRLDRSGALLQRRGPMAVFLGLNLPGARAGIVVAAGLADLRYASFAPAMLAGSTVFYGWHVALGYMVGPTAATLLDQINLPIAPILAALGVLGLGSWLLLRAQRGPDAKASESAVDRLHSWTEAACPACLAMTAIQRSRSHVSRA